jgi:DNA-binding NarL/FixJ family response regulator
MLLERPEIEAVGEAVDVNGLLSLSEKLLPDLILIDRELPGGPIEDLIAALHQLDPKPYVIIMSSEIEHSRMLLKAGADAFVSKGDTRCLNLIEESRMKIVRDSNNVFGVRRLSCLKN